MLEEIINQLEMRVASLEKEAGGEKIEIRIVGDYGDSYESISLKKFLKLATGGEFEFKDYGEGIIIKTKAYKDWLEDVDDTEDFDGDYRDFHVSLYEVCRALLTSVRAKETY